MKLTIITVAISNDKDLHRTIQSIKRCSFDTQEVELVVVCPEYVDTPYDIKHFRHIIDEKKGIFQAMNAGLKQARGEFVFFLNAGDIFYSRNVLKNIWPFLSDETKIVAGNVEIFFKNISTLTNCSPWIPHQGAFIPKNFFSDRFYRTDFKFFGDLEFWLYLNQIGKFTINRLDITIAKFEYGGLGNCGEFCFMRAQERIKLAIMYHKKPYRLIRLTQATVAKLTFLLFGRNLYYYLSIKRKLW
tara:strand:+ start:1 stop:732 length:732 start_codon:yes stop_codon:yes gene_type:complete